MTQLKILRKTPCMRGTLVCQLGAATVLKVLQSKEQRGKKKVKPLTCHYTGVNLVIFRAPRKSQAFLESTISPSLTLQLTLSYQQLVWSLNYRSMQCPGRRGFPFHCLYLRLHIPVSQENWQIRVQILSKQFFFLPCAVPQNLLQAVSLAFIGILPLAKTLSFSEAISPNFQTNCSTHAKKKNGKMHTGLFWTMRYSVCMCSCMWQRENGR